MRANTISVIEEFLDRTGWAMFEKDEKKFKIEVRCPSSVARSTYQRKKQATAQQNDGDTIQPDLSLDPKDRGKHNSELHVIDLDVAKLDEFLRENDRLDKIFYIRQRNSRDRLQISKGMFQSLCRHIKVFPHLQEFLADFKWKDREVEVGPPRIRLRPSLPRILGNRGSGVTFECAYMIRFIEFTNRPKKYPWSLRQYVVYQKHDTTPRTACTTWLIFGSSQRSERCFADHAADVNLRSGPGHPLGMHLLLLDVAIASWRPYLISLNDTISDLSEKACVMQIGGPSAPVKAYTIDVEDYQQLKDIEDRATDVLLCLDSTLDTVKTLGNFCRQVTPHSDMMSSKPTDEERVILSAFEEQERDVSYARRKTKALLMKSQNTRALISSLLERSGGYNLDQQMLVLQNLQREAQEENIIMRELAEQGSRDSASVRILTIITLIYLPCTVVSSFYSTQFVDQDKSVEGDVSMKYAKNAWIFFAVSIPLTLFTIMVWYSWANSRALYRALVAKQEEHGERLRAHMKDLTLFRNISKLAR